MQMQELEVLIDAEGNVSVAVRGLKGKSCVDLTRPLEDALGAEIASRSYTAEYYEPANPVTQPNTERYQTK